MLTRMVSISWPRDPPASASQSAGITGLSHQPCLFYPFYFIYFLFFERVCVTQTVVQWHDVGSLQPPPSRFKLSSHLSLLSSQDHRRRPPYLANFLCVVVRDGVLLCLPGWSRSPDLMICPPPPPKVLGLQAWATVPGQEYLRFQTKA